MKNRFNYKLILAFSLALLLFIISGCESDNNGANDVPGDPPPATGTNGISDGDPPTDGANENESNWDFYNQLAEAFVTAMASGDFDSAMGMLDEAMTGALGAEDLQAVWEGLVAEAGAFSLVHEIVNETIEEFFVCFVTSHHERSALTLRVVFSEDGLLAGLSIEGFTPLPDDMGTPSAQVQREGFTDYPITIGAGTDFPLNGILSMPDGAANPVPAVVIVAGSGPNDMDGNIAGNTPYRDIAEYLAANGIAVIRHDKRSFAHGEQMMQSLAGSETVWEESIEDALFAAALLRADPRVDEGRVFLLGHSLGGMLAPRIHEAGGDFAGLTLMGGTPRLLSELFIEQSRASIFTAIDEGYVEEADMEDMLEELEALEELFATIPGLSDEEARAMTIPMLGVSAYYFKDMAAHPFSDYVQGIAVPILVMQGGRDFQILAAVDYVMLQELFAGRDNATFRLYEDLNHLFVPSTAENFIEHAQSVMTPGRVYTPALQDIVDWVLGL